MTVPKRLLGLLLAGFAVFAFTACSDDGGGSDDESTDDGGDDAATCDPATLEDDITAALATFFEEPEAADKVVVVEMGDVVAEYVDEGAELAAEQGQPLEVTVQTGSVVLSNESDTAADITFGIAALEAPDEALTEAAGGAVCVDGEWLISASTVCDTLSRGFPDVGAACLNAVT
ncbi:MAG: hypothetical protein ACRDWD_00800 [Acidimicrobiia bacterium]